jgi:hypothetical protein
MVLKDRSEIDTFETPLTEANKFEVKRCHKGPKVVIENDNFRLFIGGVDDVFNLECMQIIDQVITVGNPDFAKNVHSIFEKPLRKAADPTKAAKPANPAKPAKLAIMPLDSPFNTETQINGPVKLSSSNGKSLLEYTVIAGKAKTKQSRKLTFVNVEVAQIDKFELGKSLVKVEAKAMKKEAKVLKKDAKKLKKVAEKMKTPEKAKEVKKNAKEIKAVAKEMKTVAKDLKGAAPKPVSKELAKAKEIKDAAEKKKAKAKELKKSATTEKELKKAADLKKAAKHMKDNAKVMKTKAKAKEVKVVKKEKKRKNILFIVDHLVEGNKKLLKKILKAEGKYTDEKIKNVTYKAMRVFGNNAKEVKKVVVVKKAKGF